MTKCLLAISACILLCLIFTCTCTLACKEVSRERERGEREKEEGGARKIQVTDVVTNYILIDVRLMINCYISVCVCVCVCVYVFTCTVCVCVCLMRSQACWLHSG